MWTKELPTQPGFYWWRFGGEKGNPRIVKVYQGDAGLWVSYFGLETIERLGHADGVFWTEPIICPDGTKPFIG